MNEIADFGDLQQYDSFATTKRCCANYDVINEILVCIQAYPQNVFLSYVKGRQDRKEEFEDLPIAAQLNCVAHDMCSQRLQALVAAPATSDPGHVRNHQSMLDSTQASTNHWASTKTTEKICYTPGVEKYWKKKFQLV